MKTTEKKADYSWCYISTTAKKHSKEPVVAYSNCYMCDEHYVYCDDDCMVDYD